MDVNLGLAQIETVRGMGVSEEQEAWDPCTCSSSALSLFQEARTTYRRILQESARKLNTQGSHLGSCIEKARPYYEARRLAKEVGLRGSWPWFFCLCMGYETTLDPRPEHRGRPGSVQISPGPRRLLPHCGLKI